MRIKKLNLFYQGITREIVFKNNTLIFSDVNSTGKSSLLRLLFYSMGYNIPQTKGLKFNNIETSLELETVTGITSINRKSDWIRISYKDDSSLEYFLPDDEELVLAEVWGCKNTILTKNILGAIYMDQEKGWTLLNRGTVIGNIKFKVEDLLEGLSERDITSQKIELENVNSEIKKYTQILNIVNYKDHLSQLNNDSLFGTDYVTELEQKLQIKKIHKSELDFKIQDLENSLKENKQFINYIEKMKLVVKDPESDIEIPVRENTIVHYHQNQKYTQARIALLSREQSQVEKEIRDLLLKIKEASNLFTLQSEVEKVDYLISNINLPYEQIDRTLSLLKSKKKNLNKVIKEKLSISNEILINLHFRILDYAKKLNVDSYINQDSDYIFTSDLKSLSGSVLHKIVFSFKMAYIIELQKYLGYKLPIVLDSPSGRELDQQNVEDTFNIINSDFSENQIIVASIYKYNNFIPDEVVELKDKIFSEI
ncbi:hypothetical protein [Jeotgalibaca caeni]|uniref:hypothetical protein n=1 Tax=Jeotgalibaca caeni TaxID=3028623 RepID=UPI00237EBF88|nr:hypothetical protein [Jeotgalibaca caeni]MDE1549490.1 hypothetical protein [Jeotgalibaca caeni]